jgi:hypothetical protein
MRTRGSLRKHPAKSVLLAIEFLSALAVSALEAAGSDPYGSGPGGPILVVRSEVNPFSTYYAEILLNEGLNSLR